jgi:hypothetical protein
MGLVVCVSRSASLAGRPFIDHQLEITDFYVSLQRAVRGQTDVQLIHSEEIIASFPEQIRVARNPLSLRVSVPHEGTMHEIGLVPDLVFGLRFHDGSRRCFMVEIDRGTMLVVRSDLPQTSFQRKMHAYLTAYAANLRMRSMQEALRHLQVPNSPGPALFLFARRTQLQTGNPVANGWLEGTGREVRLI